MHIYAATNEDYHSWLKLAREVEHLFGPMADEPSFQEALRRILGAGQAFCVRMGDGAPGGDLLGGVAVDAGENAIAWLAVAGAARGKGLGKALMARALVALDASRDVVVQTFAPEHPEGLPARNLYLALGFRDHAPAEPTPAGVPTVIMVRPASRS